MALKKAKPKQTMSVVLHFRIPEELYREILDAAATENRTSSNVVRVLLQEALAHRKGNRPR
jgi:hypothetical protein